MKEWSVDFLYLTNRENLFLRRFNEIDNENQLGFFWYTVQDSILNRHLP